MIAGLVYTFVKLYKWVSILLSKDWREFCITLYGDEIKHPHWNYGLIKNCKTKTNPTRGSYEISLSSAVSALTYWRGRLSYFHEIPFYLLWIVANRTVVGNQMSKLTFRIDRFFQMTGQWPTRWISVIKWKRLVRHVISSPSEFSHPVQLRVINITLPEVRTFRLSIIILPHYLIDY